MLNGNVLGEKLKNEEINWPIDLMLGMNHAKNVLNGNLKNDMQCD